MRRGYLSKQDHTLLRGFRRALEVEEGFKPIYLYVRIDAIWR
jgi:hypothetical protein